MHCNNILINIQQNATLHSLFYLETALHVSGATTTHNKERKQLFLQHLVTVTPLLLSAVNRGRVGTGLSVLWVAYVAWRFQGEPSSDHVVPTAAMYSVDR